MEMTDQSGQAPMHFPEVDQETFDRVWQRVMSDQTDAQTPTAQRQMPMTQRGQDTMGDDGMLPWGGSPAQQGQSPMMQGQMPMAQGQMPMMQGQMPMARGQQGAMGDDGMLPWGGSPAWQDQMSLSGMPQLSPGPVRREPDVLACFEGDSAGLVPLLESLMDNAAAAERDYLALSRRANGQTSRMIARHAARHRKQLRRLSAAHFLITGTRYQPRAQGAWRYAGSVPLALRELFMRERQRAAELRGGVEGSGDPCLRALFAELSGEEEALADDIRLLLEEF